MNLFKKKNKIVVPVIKGSGQNVKVRCNGCGRLIDYEDLERNYKVCPYCGYHFRMFASESIKLLSDQGTFEEIGNEIKPVDVLNFSGAITYKEKLKKFNETTGLNSAILTGKAKINSMPVALGAFAYEFISGTLGAATGEKIVKLTEIAEKNKLPLIIMFSSGGERIQEGVISLFQVAKVIQSIEKYKNSGGLFLSILSNPVLGGVASIAMSANIVIAEKNSYIGTAGPRISEHFGKYSFSKQSQKAENLLKKGFIDIIAERAMLKKTVGFILQSYNRWEI